MPALLTRTSTSPHLGGEPADVVERREVGLQGLRAGARRDRSELRGIAPVEQQLRAFGVQPRREGTPEPVGGAGDKDDALGRTAAPPSN